MPGQAIVAIKDREWTVDIASLPWELSQGLGGITEMPVGAGMFFDTGFEHIIQVTTEPMLFPLDIAFQTENLTVTRVYRSVEPGLLVTSTIPARYFLEVNAGELEGVEPGDSAFAEWLALEETPVISDWVPLVFSMAGLLAIGIVAVGKMGTIYGH